MSVDLGKLEKARKLEKVVGCSGITPSPLAHLIFLCQTSPPCQGLIEFNY
mgnify:CR=1 FL=1